MECRSVLGVSSDVAADHRDADHTGARFCGCIGNKDVAVADAARFKRLTFNADGVAAGPAQIEHGGEIEDAVVLLP